ncbi:MAG TPA: hypothetical protein VJ783_14075 [Pirellulales bacterium]|nr:hypothetical protein [Pirellulales bacterium]
MTRPQFSLKTMLWLMLVAASFFAGMAVQRGLMNHREPAFYHAQPPME